MNAYPHLIAAYEAVATASGEPLSVALTELSEAAGMKVDLNVFGKWRRAERTPPARALRYMAEVSVSRVLASAGVDPLSLSDEQKDRIAAGLTPPPRQ